MFKQAFNGTGKLLLLLIRLNWLKITVWLSSVIMLTVVVAVTYPTVYKSQLDMIGYGITMQNPAMVAMLGPAYALEEFNHGVILACEMLIFTIITVAVMNILLVGSSTRKDEELGRLELIRSLPVGQLAYLSATIMLVTLFNGILIVSIGSGLSMIQETGYTLEASFLYGAVIGATGLFFAGVMAVAAQLAGTTRGAAELAFGYLIVSYLMRAIGDVKLEALSLMSPLGWSVRIKVFAQNNWWPIVVLVVGFVLLMILAFWLNSLRDLFSGLLPTPKGKTHASGFLKTLPGLVWHLEKTKFIAWLIAIVLMTAAFGAIFGELETYFADLGFVKEFLSADATGTITQQFINLTIAIMAFFTVIPCVSLFVSLKNEEKRGRTDHYFGRSISRTKVLLTYYGWAVVLAFTIQLATAIGFYLSSSQVLAEPISLAAYIQGTMIYLPAIWVLIGLSAMLVGRFPKGLPLAWLYITFAFIVLYLGNLLDFPDWVKNISVFHLTPELPSDDLNWITISLICLLALVMSLIGFIGYNNRDIQG